MAGFLIGVPLALAASLGVWLALRALASRDTLPKMAGWLKKLFAFLVFTAVAAAILLGGLTLGLQLRGVLAGAQHPSVADGDSGMALMLAGLLLMAAVLGYLAMAGLYLLLWRNSNDMLPKAELASPQKRGKQKSPLPYAKVERLVHLLFAAAFPLGSLAWLWGALG